MRSAPKRAEPAAQTPVTYSAEEATAIRRAVTEGESPVCPRCHEALVILPAVMFDTRPIREVYCPVCQHCVMVHDVVSGEWPDPPAAYRR